MLNIIHLIFRGFILKTILFTLIILFQTSYAREPLTFYPYGAGALDCKELSLISQKDNFDKWVEDGKVSIELDGKKIGLDYIGQRVEGRSCISEWKKGNSSLLINSDYYYDEDFFESWNLEYVENKKTIHCRYRTYEHPLTN